MSYTIVTKYLAPTSTKGSRISISHGRKGCKLVVGYDYDSKDNEEKGAKDVHDRAVCTFMVPYEKAARNGTTSIHDVPVGTYVKGALPNGTGYVYVLIETGKELKIV